MSTGKKKPARKRAIPFIAEFAGGERNARMALRDPTTPPELRAELERYLANPFHAAAVDQEKLLKEADAVTAAVAMELAPLRRGKPRDDTTRALIRDLGLANHKDTARELYDSRAAAAIRMRVEFPRFANILSEVAPRKKRPKT